MNEIEERKWNWQDKGMQILNDLIIAYFVLDFLNELYPWKLSSLKYL